MFTTTSAAFMLLGLGLGVSGWRFLMVSHLSGKTRNKISLLITLYFIGFALQTGGILGLGTFLFAHSQTGLFYVFVVAISFATVLALLGIYTTTYIFSPRSPQWPGLVFVFLLGFLGVLLAFITHPQPFITPERGIDWNVSFPLSLVTFYILLISIGSSFYIFLQLFMRTAIREIKFLSFVLAITAVGSILDAFVRFVLLHNATADLRTRFYDIGIGIVGLIFVFAFAVFFIYKDQKS